MLLNGRFDIKSADDRMSKKLHGDVEIMKFLGPGF